MKTIHLPAGTTHVEFGKLPKLITDVQNPNDGTDLSAIKYEAACNELKRALRRAVDAGDLSVMSPLNSMVAHEFPIGDALNRALVTVADLRQFVSSAGITVIVDAPERDTAMTAGKKWTPEKLAELKAYREAHTMPETAAKFGISEQRIRGLLPSTKKKAKPFAGLIHRI